MTTPMVDVPDNETLIAVYGAKCAACGHVIPEDNPKLDPAFISSMNQELAGEWRRLGFGEWIQEGWPRYYPAWMVRKGWRCPFCYAPNLLVALTPGEAQ